MTETNLSFKMRVALSELLGSQARGNIRTLRTYNLAYEQVRISEELAREVGVQVIPINATQTRLQWDEAKTGNAGCTLTLESQDAETVAALIEGFEGWSLGDLAWTEKVVEDLRKNGNGRR